MAESALFKKFQEEQAKKDAEYKAWEADQWKQHGAQWTKEGYKRKEDSNNSWGSSWSFTNPVINPPTNDETEVETKVETEAENKPETKVETATVESPTFASYDDIMKQNWARRSYLGSNRGFVDENGKKIINPDKYTGKKFPTFVTTGLYGDHNDLTYAYDQETGNIRRLRENWFGNTGSGWSDANATGAVNGGNWGSLAEMLANYNITFKKQGGTMNKVNYFQQGGSAPQQDIQKQVVALVQAAMSGDQKATQTVNQIMQAAKQGDQQAAQLAQMIQQVAKQMQGQATAAKWGSKLQYIKSLKFAKGGKTCPACMKDGGNTVKVAKKDVDTKTYQKQPFSKKAELDEHRLGTETSANKNGSYNTSHKPSAQDSTTIHRNTMSEDMNKIYPKVKSKACGGTAPKAKKHYFGGWL